MAEFISIFYQPCVPPRGSFPILATNAKIFDGVSATRIENATVSGFDNLIAEVATKTPLLIYGRVIATGPILTQGFIDPHSHMPLITPYKQLENERTKI